MTQYFPYGVKLSRGQMEKLSKAYANKSPITLRLETSDLEGNDELMLTATQIKRIQKAMVMKKGVDIKISKTQIRKVARHGGRLWSSLAGISSKSVKKQTGSGIDPMAAYMLLNAIMGNGLQVDSNRRRSRRALPVYVPGTSTNPGTSTKDGGLVLPVNYRSPPFFWFMGSEDE